MRFEAPSGCSLNVETFGEGRPLVLLHGFTGSAYSWTPLIEALPGGYQFIAIDIVGHGQSESPYHLDHYLMPVVIRDLVAVLRKTGHERADWLGYSMGGRTALSLAASLPEAVNRLVLVGASPGLQDRAEREARRVADEALADRVEREGVAAFVNYWESIPLFASQRQLPPEQQAAIREGRLKNKATGLANSLRGMGTGVQPFVDVRTVRMPVLALAGSLDTKFVAIGREMAEAMPDARFLEIPGAGHAAHLEQPAAGAEQIHQFLAQSTLTGGPK